MPSAQALFSALVSVSGAALRYNNKTASRARQDIHCPLFCPALIVRAGETDARTRRRSGIHNGDAGAQIRTGSTSRRLIVACLDRRVTLSASRAIGERSSSSKSSFVLLILPHKTTTHESPQ